MIKRVSLEPVMKTKTAINYMGESCLLLSPAISRTAHYMQPDAFNQAVLQRGMHSISDPLQIKSLRRVQHLAWDVHHSDK